MQGSRGASTFKWSLKLGEVAGIGIFVHWTFSILLAWIILAHLLQGTTLVVALQGVGFVLAIFACVVLHELGHALTARHYGVRTRDITLLPIGGVASLEKMPEDPWQEFWVAIAGPAVNVVIAAVLFVLLLVLPGPVIAAQTELVGGGPLAFLSKLLFVNVALVLFNLLPAFPMDGGRVLRAVLARRMDYVSATQAAASVGQVMAILFALVGFFVNPFLLFIALFVYLGAQQEAHMVQVRTLLRGVPVREAMITHFRALREDDPLNDAVSALVSGEQQDFPVVDGEQVIGLLTRSDLLAALKEGKQEGRVGELMRRDCRTVDEGAMLDDTFARMQEGTCSTLPVLRDGRLAGIVNLENVGEWMMIQNALRKAKARGEIEDIFQPG